MIHIVKFIGFQLDEVLRFSLFRHVFSCFLFRKDPLAWGVVRGTEWVPVRPHGSLPIKISPVLYPPGCRPSRATGEARKLSDGRAKGSGLHLGRLAMASLTPMGRHATCVAWRENG